MNISWRTAEDVRIEIGATAHSEVQGRPTRSEPAKLGVRVGTGVAAVHPDDKPREIGSPGDPVRIA
jgi:hypothetical protein